MEWKSIFSHSHLCYWTQYQVLTADAETTIHSTNNRVINTVTFFPHSLKPNSQIAGYSALCWTTYLMNHALPSFPHATIWSKQRGFVQAWKSWHFKAINSLWELINAISPIKAKIILWALPLLYKTLVSKQSTSLKTFWSTLKSGW